MTSEKARESGEPGESESRTALMLAALLGLAVAALQARDLLFDRPPVPVPASASATARGDARPDQGSTGPVREPPAAKRS